MDKFDINYYKKKYLDLKVICFNDNDYINHWNKFGILEGRYSNLSQEVDICTKLVGGFGNQLFMIFNIISLSIKFNKKFCVYYDEYYVNEYLKNHNTLRKSISNYKILKNIPIGKADENFFVKFNEKEYKFNEIFLESNKKYLINGYFQSFKYFSKYSENIRSYLELDYQLINTIKNKYKSFNKKILSIHVRIGDYEKLKDFHPIPPLEYYQQALSFYNLSDYQIILFSDSIEKAKEKLNPLNLNLLDSNEIFKNDEEQFYMLMLSDVRICANSSFSLMSCYVSEMYNLTDNSEFIFPSIWFGEKGPKYNIDDFRLNHKFYFLNYNNLSLFQKKYNVISTLHSKDAPRYEKYLKYNFKNLVHADKFYYISFKNYINNPKSNHISEDNYPFKKDDVIKILKNHIPSYRWGWYYQQLLKLYVFRINKIDDKDILLFDSDLLTLKQINMYENNMKILFEMSSKIHDPYYKMTKMLIPSLNVSIKKSGICHLMLINKIKLENMLLEIENISKKPAWITILEKVVHFVNNFGYTGSIFSEYELYFSYIKNNNKNNEYKIKESLIFEDISFQNFFKEKKNYIDSISYIADHHYMSRNENDHHIDNLMDK